MLAFLSVFPSYPGISGVRQREKILVFPGGLPCSCQKNQGKEDQGLRGLVTKAGQDKAGRSDFLHFAIVGCTRRGSYSAKRRVSAF